MSEEYWDPDVPRKEKEFINREGKNVEMSQNEKGKAKKKGLDVVLLEYWP